MARILVVSAEPLTRLRIISTLGDRFGDIAACATATDAIDALVRCLPDLILLDMAATPVESWPVLDELHRRDVRRDVRVVLLASPVPDAPSNERCAAVLAHPFSDDELRAVIAGVLARDPVELAVGADRGDALVRLLERVGGTLG